MIILDWRFEDGWKDVPSILREPGRSPREYHESIRGWYCRAFNNKGEDIDRWMKDNMKGEYGCTFRFNSGHPMYTVWIREDEDAAFFKLTWVCEN